MLDPAADATAVKAAKQAAHGKNVEVLSPTIGRKLLHRGLIDEIDIHILPVLLGDGIRLYDSPGSALGAAQTRQWRPHGRGQLPLPTDQRSRAVTVTANQSG